MQIPNRVPTEEVVPYLRYLLSIDVSPNDKEISTLIEEVVRALESDTADPLAWAAIRVMDLDVLDEEPKPMLYAAFKLHTRTGEL